MGCHPHFCPYHPYFAIIAHILSLSPQVCPYHPHFALITYILPLSPIFCPYHPYFALITHILPLSPTFCPYHPYFAHVTHILPMSPIFCHYHLHFAFITINFYHYHCPIFAPTPDCHPPPLRHWPSLFCQVAAERKNSIKTTKLKKHITDSDKTRQQMY